MGWAMKFDHKFRLMALVVATLSMPLLFSASGLAQTCLTSDEIDAATGKNVKSTPPGG